MHAGHSIDARYFARAKPSAEDTAHLLASSSNDFVSLDISTPKSGEFCSTLNMYYSVQSMYTMLYVTAELCGVQNQHEIYWQQ